MTDLDHLRQGLAGLADQARAAELGPAALGGARRRRRHRRIGAVIVLFLLAGLVLPVAVWGSQHRPAPPATELQGRRVVTTYTAGGAWFVIDPERGAYRRVDGGEVQSVSPNLHYFTTLTWSGNESTTLRISPTTRGGDNDVVVQIPGHATAPKWSPDGTWLVLPVFKVTGAKDDPGFTDLVFVNAATGKSERRTVQLGDRTGTWAQWADDETLLIGTEEQRFVTDGVAVVRRDGTQVSWHAMPQDDCGGAPDVAPVTNGTKVLWCRQVDNTTAALHSYAAGTGTTGPELGRVRTGPFDGAEDAWWDGGDTVILQGTKVGTGFEVTVVQLSTGETTSSPHGLPSTAIRAQVGSANDLSTAGGGYTF